MLTTWRRLLAGRRGNVVINVALLTPILIGMIALTAEWGNAEFVRNRNQRVADSAAFAAALAYNTTNNLSDMRAAANRVISLNGLSTSGVSTTLVTSPADASRVAVRVQFGQPVHTMLSGFVSGWFGYTTVGDTATVNNAATAELISQTANCILALDGSGTGIQVSGGANITGNNCGIASNAQLRVGNCGAYIKTNSATYNTNLAVPTNCGGSQPPLRKSDNSALTAVKRASSDPYAGSAVVTTARSRLTTALGLANPAAPAVTVVSSGTNMDFTSTTSAFAGASSLGCTATLNPSPQAWYFDCPAGSTKNIGTFTTSYLPVFVNTRTNSPTVTINITGTFSAGETVTFGRGTYNIRGNLVAGYGGMVFNGDVLNVTGFVSTANSGTHTFGSATYNIAGGLSLRSSGTMTFGAGTYNIGPFPACPAGSNYSLCVSNSGTITFTGPVAMTLSAGMGTSGGSSIQIGTNSTGNVFNFGASAEGNALRIQGGAKAVLGDSTTGTNVMSFAGNLTNAGGSCLVIGAATHHDIRGNMLGAGAYWLKPGQYTVAGSINFGGNGGGNVSCNGSTIGLYADGVTLVAGADSAITAPSNGGDCTVSGVNAAFCVSAGYGSVVLKPQSSGGQAGFAVIGPASTSNDRGAIFTSGASNTTINGVFYLPNGPITLSGGAQTGDAGGCLEIVGKSVNVTAGGVLGTNCISTGGAASIRVRVVQ